MKTYTCSYQFKGKTHIVHIMAEGFLDASHRLRAVGMTAQVDGVLIAEIPLTGWWKRLCTI